MKLLNVTAIDAVQDAPDGWLVRDVRPVDMPADPGLADDGDSAAFPVYARAGSTEAELLAKVPRGVPFPVVLIQPAEGNAFYRIAEPSGSVSEALRAYRTAHAGDGAATSAPAVAAEAPAKPAPAPAPARPTGDAQADAGALLGRIAALVDRDPLDLIETYRDFSGQHATMKGRAARLEHERKRVLAVVQHEIMVDDPKLAIGKAEVAARASEDYDNVLAEIEHVTAEAERLNGLAWATKNELDVVLESIRLHRTELSMLGAE